MSSVIVIAQAVIPRPFTVEARFRFQASSCGIYGGQSDIGTGLFFEYMDFNPSSSFHQHSIHVHSTTTDTIYSN